MPAKRKIRVSVKFSIELAPGTPDSMLDPIRAACNVGGTAQNGQRKPRWRVGDRRWDRVEVNCSAVTVKSLVAMVKRLNELPIVALTYTSLSSKISSEHAAHHAVLRHLDVPTLRSVHLPCHAGMFADVALFLSGSRTARSLDSLVLTIGPGVAPTNQVVSGPDVEAAFAALASHTALTQFDLQFAAPLAREAVASLAAFIASAPALTELKLTHAYAGERTPRSHYDSLYDSLKRGALKKLVVTLPLDGARLGDAIGGMDSLEELSVKLCPTDDEYLVPEVDDDEDEETDSEDEDVSDGDDLDDCVKDEDAGSGDGHAGANETIDKVQDTHEEMNDGKDGDDDDNMDDDDGADGRNDDNSHGGSDDNEGNNDNGYNDENYNADMEHEEDEEEDEDEYSPLGAPSWDAPIMTADGLAQYTPLFARLAYPRLRRLRIEESYYRVPWTPALASALRRLAALEDIKLLVDADSLATSESYAREVLAALAPAGRIRALDMRTPYMHLQANEADDTVETEDAIPDAAKNLVSARYLSPSRELQVAAWETTLRNAVGGRRVQIAALRALVPCRVLLCARPGAPGTAKSSSAGVGAQPPPSWPRSRSWHDLPPEIRLRIARETTRDPRALSHRQWAALVRYCSDRATLAAPAAPREVRATGYQTSEEEVWLRSLDLWSWDRGASA